MVKIHISGSYKLRATKRWAILHLQKITFKTDGLKYSLFTAIRTRVCQCAKMLKCPNFRADSGSYDLKVNRNGQNFEN